MGPNDMLSFIQSKRAAEAQERAVQANEAVEEAIREHFRGGLTLDNASVERSPLYETLTVNIAESASSVTYSVKDIADASDDGYHINKIKITTGTNTSIEEFIIDDISIPEAVDADATDEIINIKDIFGDFIYAESEIEIIASNAVATAEDITITLLGFSD